MGGGAQLVRRRDGIVRHHDHRQQAGLGDVGDGIDMLDVHPSEEGADIVVRRVLQNVVGGTDLDDQAPLHDGDTIADAHGFVEIVGDEDDRAAVLGLKLDQLVLHLGADQRVKGGKGLVHQKDGGIIGERAGKADALLHTARQFVRIIRAIGAEPHLLQRLTGPRFPLAERYAGQFQSEGRVLQDVHVGHQGEGLEDHGDMLAAKRHQLLLVHGGYIFTTHDDLTCGGCDQPVEHSNQRRLARSGQAHDDENLTFPEKLASQTPSIIPVFENISSLL